MESREATALLSWQPVLEKETKANEWQATFRGDTVHSG
jgi:hypothetical protein